MRLLDDEIFKLKVMKVSLALVSAGLFFKSQECEGQLLLSMLEVCVC